jgi:putative ABC transport system permease protein
VASAHGFLQDSAQFVDSDGEAIQTGGAPTLGITWAQRRNDGPLRLVRDGDRASRPPRGRDEVAMDVTTARANDFHVGDRVRVVLEGPAQEFRIVGLFSFGDSRELGFFTFAAFDLQTAQEVFDADGLVDAVRVSAAPGVDVVELRERLKSALPEYQIQSASEVASDTGDEVLDFLALLAQLLLGFAVIGLIAAAFIIFNTFSILLTQRTRELGLMRAMGASSRQVITSVVAEAAVIGAVASVAGIALGVGLARALLALVEAFGREIPDGPLVFEQRTILAAVGVGVGVTVAAAVWPAIRAARVPPVAAITEAAQEVDRPFRLRLVLGALLVLVGIPTLVVGLDRTRDAPDVINEIALVAVGALLIFLGVIVLLAPLVRPVAGLLGRPLAAIDVTGALARGNAMRNPRRSAATASALVIGLALVGLVALVGDSVKASVNSAIDRGIRADFVLKAEQFAGFSQQVGDRLRDAPDLGAVASFQFRRVRVTSDTVFSEEEVSTGVTPGALRATVDLRLQRGSTQGLGRDQVLIHTDAAREYGVGVGDQLLIQFTTTLSKPLEVIGIYDQKDFTGGLPIPFIVSSGVYDEAYGSDEQESLIYVTADGSVGQTRAAIEAELGQDFPNIQILTREQYRDEQARAIDRFLAITIALLLLSEIIAVLGIINTLALSVYERTRELGMLRSVGMTRRQIRRMVRSESLLVALIGGLAGTGIGFLWGWAFSASLRTQGLTEFSVPAVHVVAFVVFTIAAGLAAAIAPSWRASRLDVLGAIAQE